MSEELTVVKGTSLAEAKEYAEIFYDSGLFKDTKEVSQAIVKVIAGSEIGLAPFESMAGLDIIQGNITLSGNIQAAKIKENPKYDYKIIQSDDKVCEIEFFQDGESIGKSKYTIEEANKITFWDKKAGGRKKLTEKDNWKHYPSDMLFNRCISRGRKRYCPDVFGGAKVYDPEELNQDNEPRDVTPAKPKKTSKQPKVVKPDVMGTPGNQETHPAPMPDDGEIKEAEFKDVEEDDQGTEDEPGPETPEVVVEEPGQLDSEEQEEKPEVDDDGFICTCPEPCSLEGHPIESEEEPEIETDGIIPDSLIEGITKPRDALEKILEYAMKLEKLDKVKPVIVKHYGAYSDGSRYPYHIPEPNVIAIVKDLTGIKLKKAESNKSCKKKDCKTKVTDSEREEQDGLCLECYTEENQD